MKDSIEKNQAFFIRFQFAWNGLRVTFRSEASFRFQVGAAAAVLALLWLTRAQPIWWAVLLLPVAGVLSAELLNTALEKLVDKLHPEIHSEIKLVKDCAAGAVLVFSFVSLLVLSAFLVDLFCNVSQPH